jgi:hypothetical protein
MINIGLRALNLQFKKACRAVNLHRGEWFVHSCALEMKVLEIYVTKTFKNYHPQSSSAEEEEALFFPPPARSEV